MKYFIDTADIKQIVKWKDFVDGVTTNPILIRKHDVEPPTFALRMSEMFDKIFLQIDSEDEILSPEGLQGRVIYKVPLIKEKFDFINRLVKSEGVRVCGTTTYDVLQFHRACDLGCEYCIVLVCKNENRGLLYECNRTRTNYNYKTKIIAASFREKADVIFAMLEGADYATVPPNVLKKCFTNHRALADYEDYINGK